MRTCLLMALYLGTLAGCETWKQIDDGGEPAGHCDMKTSSPIDMKTQPPCPAAKGLGGDNLLCVDFSRDTLTDLSAKGWNFMNAIPDCWEIENGKLQVKNFSTFMSSCGVTLPALSASDYQKYQSFTLSVVQTVDLNGQQQRAQVMLGLDDPDNRLVDWFTGKQPRKHWAQTIAKNALPNGGSNQYQPLFKITSGAMAGSLYQGWQIESIAINGSQDP